MDTLIWWADFRKRTFKRAGDEVFIVRGREAIIGRTRDPRQVRLILSADEGLLYTARFESKWAALDFAERYYDEMRVA